MARREREVEEPERPGGGECPRRESDGLIVAGKGVMSLERRGPTVNEQPSRRNATD